MMDALRQENAAEGVTVNNRCGVRKHVTQEVMVMAENDHRLCRMHNLSSSGALLEVGWGKLTHDVEVEIIIDLPVQNIPTPHHIFGDVVRVAPEGTAVKFTVINSDAQKALTKYLAS